VFLWEIGHISSSKNATAYTSAAAKYHSFCVHLQVQEWKGHGSEFQPLEWGWKECDGTLLPLFTDLAPAPDDLLKIISCNCHTDCSTSRCICKKYNVKCCFGNCKGTACWYVYSWGWQIKFTSLQSLIQYLLFTYYF